jgi:competence protein ComEA
LRLFPTEPNCAKIVFETDDGRLSAEVEQVGGDWEEEMSNWLERYRGYVLITLINVIILGGVIVFLHRPQPLELTVTSPSPTATPLPTPTPRPLQVYVSGAVIHPDVYELPTESIVKDAIEAAGGATSEADLDRINLALSVADGQHIYVPRQGEESPPISPPTEPSGTASVKAGGKININTASQSELETLPGIGPSKAQGIIENRPYDSIEDIQKVPGIGEGTFKKIRDLITVD